MDYCGHYSKMTDFKEAMERIEQAYPDFAPPWTRGKMKLQKEWNPYTQEGGTTAAIAGEDFAISASDTRISQRDINILSRNVKKCHILSSKIILGTTGFLGDSSYLKRLVKAKIDRFEFDHKFKMPVEMCANMVAKLLYQKRFFPLFAGVVLAGIDEKGRGAVYKYDPIGSIERVEASCSGEGAPLLQPFLDNQVPGMVASDKVEKPKLTVEAALEIITDGFQFLAEREITTGDSIYVAIVQTGKKVEIKQVPMRED